MQIGKQVLDRLNTLYHFYNNEAMLFRTVTMYSTQERDRVLDQIVANRAWYWGRFSKTERAAYMLGRETVEQMMRTEFERYYEKPCSSSPIYFYIYPRSDERSLRDTLDQRSEFEQETMMLRFQLRDLLDTTAITFTLEDSFKSYRQVLQRRGIPVRTGEDKPTCPECQGRLFHIRELRSVFEKHSNDEGIYFEAQVWDASVLERVKNGSQFRI
jgi:hypothetical protein